MRTYLNKKSLLGFTMIEILGATGVVMLLTAVVGTSIMGVVDSSRDAAVERRLQTINSAYQSYLSSGGTPVYVASPSGTPASEVLLRVYGVTQTESGPIGPFLTDWPEANWAPQMSVNMVGGGRTTLRPVFNFMRSTGEVTFFVFPDNSIGIVPTSGGWGSFGSSFGSSWGSGWGSIISNYQYNWGSGYGSGWGSFGSSYGSGWGSFGSSYGSGWGSFGSSYGSGWGSFGSSWASGWGSDWGSVSGSGWGSFGSSWASGWESFGSSWASGWGSDWGSGSGSGWGSFGSSYGSSYGSGYGSDWGSNGGTVPDAMAPIYLFNIQNTAELDQALLDFVDISPIDPSYQSYLDAFNAAILNGTTTTLGDIGSFLADNSEAVFIDGKWYAPSTP